MTNVFIDNRKIDYLFNDRIAADDHNSPRAIQNAQQLQRLGFYDNLESREIVENHLNQVVQEGQNIIDDRENQYGKFEDRESLLSGPSGKFAKIMSSWQVMPDGTRRLVSAQLFGG